MTTSLHSEASKIIGKPWIENTCGPDSFDCWGVIEYMYNAMGKALDFRFDFDHNNRELVSMCMEIQKEGQRWEPVTNPKNLDVALIYEKGRPTHVGLYVDNSILHSIKARRGMLGGVCLHNYQIINRMFEKIEFYRPI